MKISKKAQYGLTAMVHLARNHAYLQPGKNNKAVSIREISKLERVPFEFLGKIFASLEKNGLVLSRHGANGGYILAKKPAKISVFDIVFQLESLKLVNCSLCPKISKCPTKNVWGSVDNAVGKALKSITLKELAK